MIRRALFLAILALVLQLFLVSLSGVVKAAVASPRTLIGLATPQFWLPLVSPVTLILFLVALHQELTEHASPGPRRVWALAAASGMAVRIGLRAWYLHAGAVALRSLPAQIRARFPAASLDFSGQWVQAILRTIIPAVIWIGLLLLFWRDVAPLGRKWTRSLAFVLCLITAAQGVDEISRILSRMHRYLGNWPGLSVSTCWNLVVLNAVLFAASAALPFFLFSVWRTRLASESVPGAAES